MKKSGRYAVKDADKKYINGDQKAKVLADAGLVTISDPKQSQLEAPQKEAVDAEQTTEE